MSWGDTPMECLEEISTSTNQILYTINYTNNKLNNFEIQISESFRNIKTNTILYIEMESIFNVKKNEPILYNLLFKLNVIGSEFNYNHSTKKSQSIYTIKEAKPMLLLLDKELDKIHRIKYNQKKCESTHSIGILDWLNIKLLGGLK